MHADEIDIDADLVRRLLAARFPQWADLPIQHVPSSGTVNVLYRLGDDMAVRLPRMAGFFDDVEKEYEWLPRLAPLLPFAIPVPLGRGTPVEGYPCLWSVYRWLEGENPTAGRLAEPALLAKDLAEFVSAVRRVDLPGGPPAYRGGPLSTLDAPTRAAIDELNAMGGMIDVQAVTAAWDASLHALAWAGPPAWVHADLMPGNLLTVGGRLSAVIDFGTVGVGDPACDHIVAWNLLPAGVRNDFRTSLQVDDATWIRGRGRALSIALIALPYYKDTNRAMADNAQHVIREVLADHQR
ncbi:aminoglycoside phosphotransferase family protein [Actinopolymorpha sp. B17G11]|uniref:aminoglycoside phosphotransferase family protein n=1 Tax=Actinopolymorpha sp. B17G11 TaxID=3160861 RepID=UPI0032E36B17